MLIVLLLVANLLWPTRLIPIPILIVGFMIVAVTALPHVAFGTVAAVIFVAGCYLRWPPMMKRLSAPRRGLALLAVVFVLHGIWLQFGWMPFRPPCRGGFDLVYGTRAMLKGPMKPEAARQFVDIFKRQYGEDAARLSGDDTVLVRPAIALFPSSLHRNYTVDIAEDLGGRSASESCSTMQQALMVGGEEDAHLVAYGYWPWNTFDEEGAVVQWLLGLHKD
ncbi:MAG: hypothetical protein AAF497_16060 [Planctomycetota bacterium]